MAALRALARRDVLRTPRTRCYHDYIRFQNQGLFDRRYTAICGMNDVYSQLRPHSSQFTQSRWTRNLARGKKVRGHVMRSY
jgi:hypothetical protein